MTPYQERRIIHSLHAPSPKFQLPSRLFIRNECPNPNPEQGTHVNHEKVRNLFRESIYSNPDFRYEEPVKPPAYLRVLLETARHVRKLLTIRCLISMADILLCESHLCAHHDYCPREHGFAYYGCMDVF